MYDDLYFVLNVGGREILGVAKYKTSNENTVIHLFVTRVGLSLPPKYEGCLFSSRKEMVEIGAYIEEALKVSGLNHKLSSQQTVEVGFSEKAFPFKDGAQ